MPSNPSPEPSLEAENSLREKLIGSIWLHGDKYAYLFEPDGSYQLLSTDRRGQYTVSQDGQSVLLSWTTDPFTEELRVQADGSLIMGGSAFVAIGTRSPQGESSPAIDPAPEPQQTSPLESTSPVPSSSQSCDFEIDTGKMPNYGTLILEDRRVTFIHRGYGGNLLSEEVREFQSPEEAEDYYHTTLRYYDPYYSPPSTPETTYLELSGGQSHKFYEVTVAGLEVTIRYGRIGTPGQTTQSTYSSPQKAQAAAEKKLNEKLKKGYVKTAIAPPERPDPDLDITQFSRPAWKPVVTLGDGPLLSSKFAGRPWLAQDEPWPPCPHCGQPLHLFLQLNLQDLPEPVQQEFGTGLLQMFHCTAYDCNPAWEPATVYYGRIPYPIQNVRIRLVEPVGIGSTPPLPEIDGEAYEANFPAATITDWLEITDYPDIDDLVAQVYGWERVSEQHLSGELVPRLGLEADEYEELYVTDSGDKLGGYPRWVQGMECPGCPLCHTPMRQVFQLASCENLSYAFGDMGIGHILQCKTHKDQFAFVWACG